MESLWTAGPSEELVERTEMSRCFGRMAHGGPSLQPARCPTQPGGDHPFPFCPCDTLSVASMKMTDCESLR